MKNDENCAIVKNGVYEALIHGYSSEGSGVCRILGRAVFVPHTLRGEKWRVRVVKVTRTAVYGRAEELLGAPSPERAEPGCPHFPLCGGCALRHMSYAEELRMKLARVNDALARIGNLALTAGEIIGAEETAGYRNKAIYAVAPGENGARTGYFRARSHELVPVSRCLLVPETADHLAAAVRDWARRYSLPAYDESDGSGLVRHVFVRIVSDGGALLCVVAAGELPRVRELIESARAAAPDLRGVVLNINKTRGNTVLAGEFKTLWGDGYISERLCDLDFRLSPPSFFQVNTAQAERLYALARQAAAPDGGTLIDLYCGTGTIGLSMAGDAARVVGVETVPEAVRDARENAARNGIENARFIQGDALECAASFARDGERPDAVIIDPPRRGLAPGVCAAIAAMSPRRLAYVSCDPATLARDLKLFGELGYASVKVTAVDMFPRTAHVETIVSLQRRDT